MPRGESSDAIVAELNAKVAEIERASGSASTAADETVETPE